MALQSAWTEIGFASVTLLPWHDSPPLGLTVCEPPLRSEVILGDDPESWHGFAPLPSNFAAFEAALKIADGFSSFCIVVGPSGWGKSHLLQVAAERSAHRVGEECRVHSPSSCVHRAQALSRTMPLIVDGVQDMARHPRLRHQFLSLIRTRVKLRRPTLIALEADSSSRLLGELSALTLDKAVFHINVPTPREREKIVSIVSRSMGMKLHETLARVIGRHVDGNGRSMLGALNRLSLYSSDWSGEGDLTKAMGITLPFLTGCDGWDIRDAVQEAVCQAIPNGESDAKLEAWLCWSLRRMLKMPEDQVAAFLGKSPGEVHQLSELARAWKDEPVKAQIKGRLINLLSD